jgi:hypothetical protein
MEVRPHVGAALAASCTDETRALDLISASKIAPSLSVNA